MFKNLLWTNSLLLYLLLFILFVYLLLFLNEKSREVILNKFLSIEDFRSYKIEKYLVLKGDAYSKYELNSRLKNLNFKGLRKILLFVFGILLVLSIFSFSKFKIVNFNDPFDTYLSKFNFRLCMNEYLEGDSIFFISEFINQDLIIEYGNKDYVLDKNVVFIGFANTLFKEVNLKIGRNVFNKRVIVHSKPRLENLLITTNYDNILVNEYKNIFELNTFLNSKISIKASFINAEKKGNFSEFLLSSDTVVKIKYCNPYWCDSIEIFIKSVELPRPMISYSKIGEQTIVKISDDIGLKSIFVNDRYFNVQKNSKIIEIVLDTVNNHSVKGTNILNKFTEVRINNNKFYYVSLKSNGLGELKNLVDQIELQVQDVVNSLSDVNSIYDFKLYDNKLINLLSVLNNLNLEENDTYSVKAKQLKELINEINSILKELEKSHSTDNKLVSDMLFQKLKNTLNRYQTKKKKRDINTESNDFGDISASEQIIFEYILLVTNNLSVDIENGKFKNKRDIFKNSMMPVLLDSLMEIMLKRPPLYEILISDVNALKRIENDISNDIIPIMYRLNNIAVTIYNLLKNIEINQMNSDQKDQRQDNSNCTNPSMGNSKKPSLSELLGESDKSIKEGEEGEEGKKESNDEKSENGNDGKDGEQKDGMGDEKRNKERNGNRHGTGSNESLEEIEKRLKNIISGGTFFDSNELKKKIKWLDYERSSRLNDEYDSRRQGNFVSDDNDSFLQPLGNSDIIKIIRRPSLVIKHNGIY